MLNELPGTLCPLHEENGHCGHSLLSSGCCSASVCAQSYCLRRVFQCLGKAALRRLEVMQFVVHGGSLQAKSAVLLCFQPAFMQLARNGRQAGCCSITDTATFEKNCSLQSCSAGEQLWSATISIRSLQAGEHRGLAQRRDQIHLS